MFLRGLNWLLKFLGLSLTTKTKQDSPPLLEESRENVIKVNFVKSTRILPSEVKTLEADQTRDVLDMTIRLPPHLHTRMNAMKRLSGVGGHNVTVRRALRLYEVYIQVQMEGGSIGYYDEHDNWIEIDLDIDE